MVIVLWVVFSILPLVSSQFTEEYAYSEQDEHYNPYSDYATESSEETKFEHQYLATVQNGFNDFGDEESMESLINEKIESKSTNLVRHPRRPNSDDVKFIDDNVNPFYTQAEVLDIPRSTHSPTTLAILKTRNMKSQTHPLRQIVGNLSMSHRTPSRSTNRNHLTVTRTKSLKHEKLSSSQFRTLNYESLNSKSFDTWNKSLTIGPISMTFTQLRPTKEWKKEHESLTTPVEGKKYFSLMISRPDMPKRPVQSKSRHGKVRIYATTGRQSSYTSRLLKWKASKSQVTLYTITPFTDTQEPMRLKLYRYDTTTENNDITEMERPVFEQEEIAFTVAVTTPKFTPLIVDNTVYDNIEDDDQSRTDKEILIENEINDVGDKYGDDKSLLREDVGVVQDYQVKTEAKWLYTLPGLLSEYVLREDDKSTSKDASSEGGASKTASSDDGASKDTSTSVTTSSVTSSSATSSSATTSSATSSSATSSSATTSSVTSSSATSSSATTSSATSSSDTSSSVTSSSVTSSSFTTKKSQTTNTKATKATEASSVFDVGMFLDILTNLTYDYDTNLTEQMNLTLHRLNFPTCGTPKFWKSWMGWPNATIEPTTPSTTEVYYEQPKALNNSVIAKCFVCGLKEKGIPYNTDCADAFAGDFLPLVPISPTARSKATSYRKYCRYGEFYNYQENATRPKSIWGRWTGGCSVRWTDLTGLYTQRTCRNRRRAVTGEHFASKRMAKLEMALSHLDDGCIITPTATLLPMSRGISLYSRFHACVCTGSWCNKIVRLMPSVIVFFTPAIWVYRIFVKLVIL